MDINTVMIIIAKIQHNLRYFNLIFCLNSITPCDITEYFIVGLKTIYSNIKFFLFQLILAKMVITFERVGNSFFPFSMLYSGEQIMSFKPCLFYSEDSKCALACAKTAVLHFLVLQDYVVQH